MPKVLIIHPLVSQIFSHLCAKMEVAIIVREGEKKDPCFNWEDIKDITGQINIYKFIPKYARNNLIQYIKFLRNVIGDNQFDYLLINGIKELPFLHILLKYLLKDRKPLIVAISHNSIVWQSILKKHIALRIMRLFSDGIVVLSQLQLERMMQLGVPRERIKFIPNAFNGSHYDSLLSETIKTKNILCVSNINQKKGQDVLIKAFHAVHENFPDTRCIFVGEVQDDKYFLYLQKLLLGLNLDGWVDFAGWVPRKTVISLINDCRIFVFPSYSEFMPRAVIEAMWYGKPVIASRVDGILDLIEDETTGLLIAPGDVNNLEKRITELLIDPIKAEAIGMKGKNFIRKICSVDNVGNAFKEFYGEISTLHND